MIILHISDVNYCKANGVISSLNLFVEEEQLNNKVALFSLADSLRNNNITEYLYKSYNSILNLPKPFCKPDIVIFNEVYKPLYIKLYKECLKNHIPYIIIPHGCLVKKAQFHHRFKKILGNLFLFNKFIESANAIQFLNEKEKNDCKFKYQKSIISSNGIKMPNKFNNYKNKDFIFIGRYDIYIKGLDLIIDMCKKHKNWFINNKVNICFYGRKSLTEKKKLLDMIKVAGVGEIISVNDPIYEQEKIRKLIDSYAFIQTSRHEGQPMGILEALSVGLPCIVTYGTSFGEYVNKNKCGIGIDFNEKELFDAINKLYFNQELRNEYSKNGIYSIKRDYLIDDIVKGLIKDYEKIINKRGI